MDIAINLVWIFSAIICLLIYFGLSYLFRKASDPIERGLIHGRRGLLQRVSIAIAGIIASGITWLLSEFGITGTVIWHTKMPEVTVIPYEAVIAVIALAGGIEIYRRMREKKIAGKKNHTVSKQSKFTRLPKEKV